ncbi:unnamed protein product [Caenorhabditis nigoni]
MRTVIEEQEKLNGKVRTMQVTLEEINKDTMGLVVAQNVRTTRDVPAGGPLIRDPQGRDPKSQTTKKLQTKEMPLAKEIPTTEKSWRTTQRIRIKKKNRETEKPLRSCSPKTSAPSSNSI